MNKVLAAAKIVAISLASGITFVALFVAVVSIAGQHAQSDHPKDLKAFYDFEKAACPVKTPYISPGAHPLRDGPHCKRESTPNAPAIADGRAAKVALSLSLAMFTPCFLGASQLAHPA